MEKAPEFLKSNDHHLKFCILYEVALNKPIFDSYRTFCDAVGPDAMEYRDFEFWYHRFSLGELDFDYDRSMDPAMPKTLMDMPVKLTRKITEDLSPFERRHLRSTSHDIKNFNDSFPTVFKSIRITAADAFLIWKLDTNEFRCSRDGDGCSLTRPKYLNTDRNNESSCDETVRKTYPEGYITKSREYLTPLFKIPNLQTNYLWWAVSNQLPDLGDLLPVPFYAKSAYIADPNFDKATRVLLKMQPGHLESFQLSFFREQIARERLTRVFETEQFKKAQIVQINHNAVKFNTEDLANFSHLKQFSCGLKSIVELEEILQIRDIVSTFNNLEFGSIVYNRNGRPIRLLAEVLDEEVPVGPVNSFTHRYKSPESNKALDFTIRQRGDYCYIEIQKVG